MAKSTRKRRQSKPAKPHPDFPLFAHNNGQWAKKVRGDLHYFGKWDDPQKALAAWNRQKDTLLETGEKKPDHKVLTVKRLADTFLTSKRHRVDSGELSPHTYRDYVVVCQFIADELGKHRNVATIKPADFAQLRASFAKVHGAYRLAKDVRVTRMVFKYGMDNELIERVVKFGSDFIEPDKKAKRRAKRANGKTKQYFEATELRRILDAAPMPLRAMILLAANCGLGNTDCAELRWSHIEDGWLNFPRPKTETDRRCPLWPETQQALAQVAETRPTPKDPADADCVFCTKYGKKWVRLNDHEDPAKRVRVDAIAQEFRKVMKKLDLNGRRNFYSVRHSHRTAAGAAKDKPAADHIMGHSPGDMSGEYTHHISDERLRDVVIAIWSWLWPADDDDDTSE